MKLKVIFSVIVLTLCIGRAQAQFSTDAPILLKMLANGVSQLYQLYNMVETTKRNYYLMREMYEGIHHAVHNMEEIGPENFTPLVYGHWQNGRRALNELKQIYGFEANSKNSRIERDADLAIAEAMSLSNTISEASSVASRLGQAISNSSHSASPKGASRLTAQGVGAMVETSGQSLKVQSEAVKLQAQALAIQNRKDKEETKHRLETAKILKRQLKRKRKNFITPRFTDE